MYFPSIVSTSLNRRFNAQAVDFIQPYLSTSLSEVRSGGSKGRRRITKRTTNHSRIIHIPAIVTNCSPRTVVEYLNPTFSAPASSNKSQPSERNICVAMGQPTILAQNVGTISKPQRQIPLTAPPPPSPPKCIWGSRAF